MSLPEPMDDPTGGMCCRPLYNGAVLRGVIALGVCVCVHAAAVSAPLVHAHVNAHGGDHHRHGAAVHAHLAGHAPAGTTTGGPVLNVDERERTIYLQLFVAVALSPFGFPAVVPEPFSVTPPPERAAHLVLHVAHGHDPPLSTSIAPRAPPASLS